MRSNALFIFLEYKPRKYTVNEQNKTTKPRSQLDQLQKHFSKNYYKRFKTNTMKFINSIRMLTLRNSIIPDSINVLFEFV